MLDLRLRSTWRGDRFVFFTPLMVLLLASLGAAESVIAEEGEVHLHNIRQLTFGGENAEAYWSPDGSELIMQSTREPYGCDQIFSYSQRQPRLANPPGTKQREQPAGRILQAEADLGKLFLTSDKGCGLCRQVVAG